MSGFFHSVPASVPKFDLMAQIQEDKKQYPHEPARLVEGVRWYIEFSAWDLKAGKLKRKRVGKIKGATAKEKRAYAADQISQINHLLKNNFVFNAGEPEENDKVLPEKLP